MKIIYSISTMILVAFLLGSCARKLTFAPSTVVPAATGQVKYKKDDNNNYTLTVSVVNLAEAKNLNPPRNLYVVWLDADRGGAKNIGQINTSTSLLSKTLKGELKATSTSKPNRVFITAEDNNTVQYPGAQVVLSTQ
jgi:hypothetical protein